MYETEIVCNQMTKKEKKKKPYEQICTIYSLTTTTKKANSVNEEMSGLKPNPIFACPVQSLRLTRISVIQRTKKHNKRKCA